MAGRMRIVVGLAVVMCWLSGARAADNSPPEGFEAIFNGKDLTNFKASDAQKQHWVVKDGVLDLVQEGKPKQDLTMWTEKEYGDLVMMVDYRFYGPAAKIKRPILLPSGDEKKDEKGAAVTEEILEYDSGVYLRGNSKSQVNMWNWPAGSGEVYGYRTDRKMPAEVRAGVTPKKKMDKPIGEWNHMVITMKGDRLTVELNGEEVISNAQLPGVPKSGPLALQDHGNPIQFKNVYVKEIK